MTKNDEEGTGIYGSDFNVSIPFAIGTLVGMVLCAVVLVLVLFTP